MSNHKTKEMLASRGWIQIHILMASSCRGKMGDPRLASRHLVYYCDDDPAIRANTAYLLGAFLVHFCWQISLNFTSDNYGFCCVCVCFFHCRFWSSNIALTKHVHLLSACDLIHFRHFAMLLTAQSTIRLPCAIALRHCWRLSRYVLRWRVPSALWRWL